MTARLFHGDCLQVMKDLSANSIDCFICDLPYGCLTGGGGQEKRKQKNIGKAASDKKLWGGTPGGVMGVEWDIPIDLEAFWKEVKRLAKDEHTPVLMFCTTKFGYELIKSNEKWFRYDLVWDKQRGVSFLSANKMPMRSHEMVYVFSKAGAHYNRVDISGNFPKGGGGGETNGVNVYGNHKRLKHITEAGRRCVKSVIQSTEKDTKIPGKHPTEKPISIYRWLIERYCPANGTVLDPTAGSFNSVAAAMALNRNAIGIEKNAGFFEKAQKRFAPPINSIVEVDVPG